MRRVEQGYVALMAVMVLGAISIAIGLALLTIGTDSQREVLVRQHSTQARNLATACAEEALQQIHDTSTYAGTGSVSLASGSCNYTVADQGGDTWKINASSTLGNVTRAVVVYGTINASSISITSWQDDAAN